MKFARDVSTRVFFMFDCYIHEEGTPHQIFEEPVHSATKAFVQRIHKLVFELEGHDADSLSMLSDMSKFCIKYNIADKRDVIEQISTEMLTNVLYDYRPMTVRLTYGELKDITAVDFMIKDLTSSPFQADGFDPHLLDDIRALSKEIIEEPTKLGFRIKVIL
jgi:ABC-type glutathione transport system ATPase component